MTENKRCDYCHSEEGKPRPIGRYIVQLKPAEVKGVIKLACQSCMMSNKEFLYALRNQMESDGSSISDTGNPINY